MNDIIKKHMPDGYLQNAWLGLVNFALGSDDILAHFRADTGNNFQPASTAIDKMIDEATGSEIQFLDDFLGWLNKNRWGLNSDGSPYDGSEEVCRGA